MQQKDEFWVKNVLGLFLSLVLVMEMAWGHWTALKCHCSHMLLLISMNGKKMTCSLSSEWATRDICITRVCLFKHWETSTAEHLLWSLYMCRPRWLMALFIVFESKTASFVPVVSKSSSSSRSCKPDGAVYRSLFISIDIWVFFKLDDVQISFL